MNRRLILALVLVAAVGAGLFFFLRGDDKAPEQPKTAEKEATPERDVRSTTPDRVDAQNKRKPQRGAPEINSDVYELEDGTVVRDHRATAGGYIRPSLPHKSASPVNAHVTSNVMRAVRPIVLGCIKDLPAEAYGDKPFVETRAVVTVDDAGTLTVIELGPALHDIDENLAADALTCIRDGAADLTLHVDHGAVEEATVAFKIRPFDRR